MRLGHRSTRTLGVEVTVMSQDIGDSSVSGHR
jgi:hypothetical protein